MVTEMANIFDKTNITKVEKVEVSTPEKEQRSLGKILKVSAVSFLFFSVFSILLIKYANPAFSPSIVTGLIITCFLLSVLLFFLPIILDKFKKNSSKDLLTKLQPSASLATLRGLAEEALVNDFFCNHVARILDERMIYVGKDIKNKIYILKGKLLYRESGEAGIVHIILNTHDPINTRTILIDGSALEISRAINSLCSSPEEEKDFEEIERENPLLGTKETRRKYSKHREEKEEKENKREDL